MKQRTEEDYYVESKRIRKEVLEMAEVLKECPLRFTITNGITMDVEITKSDLKTVLGKIAGTGVNNAENNGRFRVGESAVINAFLSHRSQNLLIFFFSRRMRRTLWLMRSSLMVPLLTAFTTASNALTKFCGPSTMSTPAWIHPTAALKVTISLSWEQPTIRRWFAYGNVFQQVSHGLFGGK